MAIGDNTSYELTGAQVKDLANKIKAKAADNIFVGATSAAPGSKGLVPAPQAGDDTKFLSGDGTWKTVSGGGGSSTTLLVVDMGSIQLYPAFQEASSTQIFSQLTFPNQFALLTEDGYLISKEEFQSLCGQFVALKINTLQVGSTMNVGNEAILGSLIYIGGPSTSTAVNNSPCMLVYANDSMQGFGVCRLYQNVMRRSDSAQCPTFQLQRIS